MREMLCSRCGEEKEEKYREKSSYCKKCSVERVREYEKNNPEKIKYWTEKRRIKKQTEKCKVCKIKFLRFRGEKTCSIKCKLIHLKKLTGNGCWIYPYIGGRGYGQFSFRGKKNLLAHRTSYQEFKGEIPEKMQVCHSCDVPSCINPDHLFLGTAKQNIHDAIKKGRAKHIGAKGRNCKFTNLTDEQIEEMRSLYMEGFNYSRLARIFNCQRDYASKIVREKVRKKRSSINEVLKNGLQREYSKSN